MTPAAERLAEIRERVEKATQAKKLAIAEHREKYVSTAP